MPTQVALVETAYLRQSGISSPWPTAGAIRRCPCQVVVAGKASRLPLYLHTQNTARVLASTQCLGLATPGTRCALAWRCPGAPRSLLRGMWPPGLCPLQRANCSFRLDASLQKTTDC